MKKKAEMFKVLEVGTRYELPLFTVEQGLIETDKNLEIPFVRGSKLAEDKVEKVDGIVHEQLLGMALQDLEYKNFLVPSPWTELAISGIKIALQALESRQAEREKNNTLNTYKP